MKAKHLKVLLNQNEDFTINCSSPITILKWFIDINKYLLRGYHSP